MSEPEVTRNEDDGERYAAEPVEATDDVAAAVFNEACRKAYEAGF